MNPAGTKEDINIKADKGRISQVLSNLLSNAIKFTEEGDSVFVSVKKKEDTGKALWSMYQQ